MKSIWYRLVIGMAGLILLFPASVVSCPVCFSSASKNVLHTYYISAIFLSLLPFSIVGLFAFWFYVNRRKFAKPQTEK